VRVVRTAAAREQYVTREDRRIVRRINTLIKDIQRGGSEGGIGKPEMLRGELSGFASRRIDQEHRLVYRVRDGDIEIIACRRHYEK
jgi:toxin YoeB